MVHLGLVVLLVLCCIDTCTTATDEWTAAEYPNPQTHPESCGRGSVKSSVCDPNGVIFSEDADKLDTIIASVAHKTISGCSGSSGYPIGVALVKKFKDTSETAMTGNESDDMRLAIQMQRKLGLSRTFARETHTIWQLGDCDEDVIITYSEEDRVMYTFAGDAAKRKLSNFIINDITNRAKIDADHIFDGLSKMIHYYGAVFNDTYIPTYTPPTLYPNYQPVRTGALSSAERPHTYIAPFLAASIVFSILSGTI